MANSKTKSGKFSKIFLISIIALAVIAVAGILVYVFLPRNTEPVATMECSVNPDVQFVLNSDNKVVSVNYLNDDAEVLLKSENFVGKSADNAAQIFVKLSTEAGYIDIETTGTKVSINFSVKADADYTEISQKVVAKVNAYFDENGIIAGAVAKTEDDISKAFSKLKVSASEVSGKTEAELLSLLKETSNEIDGIALSLQDSFFTYLTTLKSQFSDMTVVEDTISTLSANIDKYEAQLKQSSLTQTQKDAIQILLDAAKDELKVAEKQYKEYKAEFDKKLDEKIEELKAQSKAIYEQAKQALNTRIEDAKATISAHKSYYEQNKQAILQSIENYRSTLA